MILIGNQRGGAYDLAQHLLKAENERVEIHELRGFIADDLKGAMQESYAVSRGTKCKQHLFSLSLNPPKDVEVDNAVFEDAIERIEDRLGLSGQPRAIVFHEKNGRRHAHAVWCRIDTEEMKAIQLSHSGLKLQEIAREIYIERDWRMPEGFVDREFRDSTNFTLAEWQQAKRAEKDPKAMKKMFQDCWAVSDGHAAFQHALKERGFVLARGDRRGAVAVDHTGEVYAISRWVGVKAKQVRNKVGDLDKLPSVAEAHRAAAQTITKRLSELKAEQERAAEAEKVIAATRLAQMSERQKMENAKLKDAQNQRREQEEQEREARLRKGLAGMWDRLTGRRKRTVAENKAAAMIGARRDSAERQFQKSRQASENLFVLKEAARSRLARREIGRGLRSDIKQIDDRVEQNVLLPRPAPQKSASKKQRQRRGSSRNRPRRER